MKKLLLTLVCACALTLGAVFAAQAETTGVYVAPKFMMMWQNNYSNFGMDASIAGMPGRFGENRDLENSQFTLGGALAVGYDFYPRMNLPIRAEIEFAMRGNNEFSDDESHNLQTPYGSVTINQGFRVRYNASTLLTNFYWDFHNDSAFTPYVMAGAGLAFINAKYEYNINVPEMMGGRSSEGRSMNKNFTNFAWALGAGCAYNINENFAVDLGYRYLNLGQVKTDTTARAAGFNVTGEAESFANNHEIMLGLRYTF